MNLRSLTIRIEDHAPIAVIHLTGFMAQLEVYKLKSQIEPLLAEGRRYLVLNLAEVTFIDSAGIGVIAQLRGEAARAGGLLMLVQAQSAQVVQAIQVAALQKVIDIHADGETALGAMRQKLGLSAPTTSAGTAPEDSRILDLMARRLEQMDDRLRRLEERVADIERRSTGYGR